MINQHRQSVEDVQQAVLELQEFIAVCRDAREARKALAVKLIYQGYLYEEIQKILDVSQGSDCRLETSISEVRN
jgi:putative transposase